MFDVYYGIVQINFLTVVIWAWLWLWFGVFVCNKVALAMIEDSYLENKHKLRFDFLTKETKDPYYSSEKSKIPRAVKMYRMTNNAEN